MVIFVSGWWLDPSTSCVSTLESLGFGPWAALIWWSSSVLGWSQRSLQRPWNKRGQHKGSKLGCKSKKTSPPGSWADYDPKTWFWFKFQVTFKWRRLYINDVHLRVIKPGSRISACNVILVVTISWFGASQAPGQNSGYLHSDHLWQSNISGWNIPHFQSFSIGNIRLQRIHFPLPS